MKPVRRDPEKRRQQNVQAQKKYREKLRARLDHLKALEASAAQSSATQIAQTAGTSPFEAVKRNASSSTPTHVFGQSLPAYDASDISISISSAAIWGEHQYLTPQSSSALSTWDSPSVSCSSATTPEEWPYHIPQFDDGPPTLSLWDSTTYINPSLLIHDKHNGDHGSYWTTTIGCGCSIPHVQIQTRGPDPSNYDEVKILSFGSNAITADPFANNFRIETICITIALYTLVRYIGINEEMFCADNSPSPFFRSSVESADDSAKANTVSTVQKMFKTLKPDLRPSNEQITIEHHPYIDILPFPTLRKNLITHQAEINEDEFFDDMLTGLVCWGGGGKNRNDSTGYSSTCTPWDVRSWEAKAWFLKKYWVLLGGEEGELVKQSEWWRNMRGDDTEIPVNESVT